jgi:hypothetical protein
MFADSSNLLQGPNPFPGRNLETILRLRGVVHIGTQHVTITPTTNHHRSNIETPRDKNPLSMLIARIPEDWTLALGIVEESVCPISLHQGLLLNHIPNGPLYNLYLTSMHRRQLVSQSTYISREPDRPPAWIPPSPPRPRSVSWSERPRHEDWNRPPSPPARIPPTSPALDGHMAMYQPIQDGSTHEQIVPHLTTDGSILALRRMCAHKPLGMARLLSGRVALCKNLFLAIFIVLWSMKFHPPRRLETFTRYSQACDVQLRVLSPEAIRSLR